MTASVPDGISFGDLENLMSEAAKREEAETSNPGPSEYQEKVAAAADHGLQIALEDCEDPMVHKLMALKIASNMIDWHTRMGQNLMEDEPKAAVAWLRDAGKFQSIINILLEIEVGEQDWTAPQN